MPTWRIMSSVEISLAVVRDRACDLRNEPRLRQSHWTAVDQVQPIKRQCRPVRPRLSNAAISAGGTRSS